MKFEENLRELRKQNGLSQEELAEKLDVSRQAVSKWENGSGYPELDKLMTLCDLFHCTMDDLLKGNVQEYNFVSVERYNQHYDSMSKAMTFGIFMILSAVTSGAFLQSLENTKGEIIMGAVFFTFVTIGILMFVYYGMQNESFKKKYPNIPDQMYRDEEVDTFEKKFRIAIVCGVGLLLISIIVEQVLEVFFEEYIANGVFMALVTVAVSIFVYYGTQKSKYEDVNKKVTPMQKRQEALIGKCCGVIMILSTIIFFVWGMAFHGWALSWLAFVVGGLLCGVVSIILNKEE